MTPFNELAINAVTNTGTVTSDPIFARFIVMATAQAVFSDAAAAGTLKIQGSNDDKDPTHWNDIPSATATVASGATTMTPVLSTYFCYQFIRVVWTNSGGAGTFSVRVHGWGG